MSSRAAHSTRFRRMGFCDIKEELIPRLHSAGERIVAYEAAAATHGCLTPRPTWRSTNGWSSSWSETVRRGRLRPVGDSARAPRRVRRQGRHVGRTGAGRTGRSDHVGGRHGRPHVDRPRGDHRRPAHASRARRCGGDPRSASMPSPISASSPTMPLSSRAPGRSAASCSRSGSRCRSRLGGRQQLIAPRCDRHWTCGARLGVLCSARVGRARRRPNENLARAPGLAARLSGRAGPQRFAPAPPARCADADRAPARLAGARHASRRRWSCRQATCDPEYSAWIRARLSPAASVLSTAEEIADAVAAFELSDALLIIDPTMSARSRLGIVVAGRSTLPQSRGCRTTWWPSKARWREPRNASASTQQGDVRRILRHYEPATWPFIAGVPATLLPVASGLSRRRRHAGLARELRQMLTARGVPSRDVPVNRGAFDLTHEAGLLAANEHFVRKVTGAGRTAKSSATPLFIGTDHSIHESARITGPVVIHAGAQIDDNAMVFGPAVIGARAHASPRVRSSSTPSSARTASFPVARRAQPRLVRAVGDPPLAPSGSPQSYTDRLARLMTDARSHEEGRRTKIAPRCAAASDRPFKRALDVTVAASGAVRAVAAAAGRRRRPSGSSRRARFSTATSGKGWADACFAAGSSGRCTSARTPRRST